MASPHDDPTGLERLVCAKTFSHLSVTLDPQARRMLLIDDVPLLELVTAIERPFAAEEIAERNASEPREPLDIKLLAGRYVPVPWALGPGEFADDDPRSQKAALLICDCGFAECWSLLARVTVLEDRVIWSDFQQSARSWTYDLAFVFEREAYERALAPKVV